MGSHPSGPGVTHSQARAPKRSDRGHGRSRLGGHPRSLCPRSGGAWAPPEPNSRNREWKSSSGTHDGVATLLVAAWQRALFALARKWSGTERRASSRLSPVHSGPSSRERGSLDARPCSALARRLSSRWYDRMQARRWAGRGASKPPRSALARRLSSRWYGRMQARRWPDRGASKPPPMHERMQTWDEQVVDSAASRPRKPRTNSSTARGRMPRREKPANDQAERPRTRGLARPTR